MSRTVFEEPEFVDSLPGRSMGSRDLAGRILKLIPALKANPKKWAIVAEYQTQSGASGAQRALIKTHGMSISDWDFAGRRCDLPNGKSGSRLYMRYIGPVYKAAEPDKRGPGRPAKEATQLLNPNAAFAVCSCSHTQRRHTEDGGPCIAAGCSCIEYCQSA